jgi:hypothetical protein
MLACLETLERGGELFDNKMRGQHGGEYYELDIGNFGI